MKTAILPIVLVALLLSGCTALTGLPEGSADLGDSVTVRYTMTSANGTVLRADRIATFVIGSGDSGVGQQFERALRGHVAGDNLTFEVEHDGSLGFASLVEVPKEVPPLARMRSVNRVDFEDNLGPARVGQDYPIFGVYTATVTAVTQASVNFTVNARVGQRDPFASIGATLVSSQNATHILRSLEPLVGTTFSIAPATASNPSPLGLAAGSYRTEGATPTTIRYAYSQSGSPDFIGASFGFKVQILRLVTGEHAIEPSCDVDEETGARSDCNYAVRPSPYVNGDPATAIGASAATSDGHDDHAH